MIDYTQLSDTELQEAVSFHRRQRNMSRGINEAAHARQAQIVRLMEAEEARRLDESEAAYKKADRDEKRKAGTGEYFVTNSNNKKTHSEPFKTSDQAISHANAQEDKTGRVHTVHHIKNGKIQKQWQYSDSAGRFAPYSDYAGQTTNIHEEVDLEESRKLLAARKSAERAADQGVRVDKKTYGWGKMVTVHDGIRKSFPLHPEHQEKIKNLKHGESTTFTDETRNKVKAHREGDTVHLQRTDSDKKTSVPYSHFAEEVEQIDELSSEKKMAYGKAAFADYHKQSKAKLGKILSGDKDTSGESRKIANRLKGISTSSKTEEVELDEISRDLVRSYIRKVADKNNTGEASPKEVMKRSPGLSLAGKKAYGIGGKAKVNATEEVELDEVSKELATRAYDGESRDRFGFGYYGDDHPIVISPKTHQGKIIKLTGGHTAKKQKREEANLDEGVKNLSDARLKFHVLKDVPHGSYTKKELSAEHDRRKKTDGAEYNSVKPSMNEANILPSNFSDRTTPLPNKKAYAVDKANSEKKPVSLKKAPWDMKKEEVDLDEAKTDVYHKHMLKALGKTRLPKDHGYTSSIANNGDFVVRKGGEVAGRIPKGEHNLKEASMTPTDMKQREDIVKGMKKSAQDFKDRYGSKWKSVMYATATKAAMKEESEQIDETTKKSNK